MSSLHDQVEDVLALASRLTHSAGLSELKALHRMEGGRNNRLYRVELAGGDSAVLKLYFRHPSDTRDRLSAEWDFLVHAQSRATDRVAVPLVKDEAAGAALFSFIPGRALKADDVTAKLVLEAADFARAVADVGVAGELLPASEACFTPMEHVNLVDRRIGRLAAIDDTQVASQKAVEFVVHELSPAWRKVKQTTLANLRGMGPLEKVLPNHEMVASPSDFGFHNALLTEDGLAFVDFEYAGGDDPAKLICDFFCQPRVPVPSTHHDLFVSAFADRLGLRECRQRVGALLETYRMKWIAIILNDFLPGDAERRAFGHDEIHSVRLCRQLALAKESLAYIVTKD